MNGTAPALNLPLDSASGEDAAFTDVGVGLGGGAGKGAALLIANETSLLLGNNSSLVKYRKPATPIATIETTPTINGHIQYGVAAGAAFAGDFLTCGEA